MDRRHTFLAGLMAPLFLAPAFPTGHTLVSAEPAVYLIRRKDA